MERRWDGDERGHGVASGESHAPHARRRSRRWSVRTGSRRSRSSTCSLTSSAAALGLGFGLGGAAADGSVYELRLTWLGDQGRGPVRRAAHALIGSVAEESTHVAEWVDGDAVVFDVATGKVSDDGHFAPHGHLLRLRIQTGRAA